MSESNDDTIEAKPAPAMLRWAGMRFDAAASTRKIDLSRFLQDVVELRKRDPVELKERLERIREIVRAEAAKPASKKEQPTSKPPMTVWPAALRLDQAAEYCGLSVETFKAICPVKPIEYTGSSKGNRWLKVKLDEWLVSLDPNSPAPAPVRRLGERVHGGQSAS
jgi:hypothetical protein